MVLRHERSEILHPPGSPTRRFAVNPSLLLQCDVHGDAVMLTASPQIFKILDADARYFLLNSRIPFFFFRSRMAAAMIRSSTAGCSAIAGTANSIQQEKWERPSSSSGCVIGGLTSDLFCKKAFLVPKNACRPSFRVGRVGPIRSKMFVPGFGEASPEAQAAAAMHNFFTYVAVKIVSSQLEDYNKEAYVDLMAFLEKMPLKDGDKFIAALMRESFRHKNLALRIMEVRSAYAKQDFEWDNLQDLSAKKIEEANTSLMRKFLTETSNME